MIIGGWPPQDLVVDLSHLPIRLMLEVLRAISRSGSSPVQVTSWYRTVDHNTKVGGHPDSQHLIGLAVDVAPAMWLPLHPSLTQLNEGDHTHVQLFPHGVATQLVRSLRR